VISKGRVVELAVLALLVDRSANQHNTVRRRTIGEESRDSTGHRLRTVEKLLVLYLCEVLLSEELLQAHDLCAFSSGCFDESCRFIEVLVDFRTYFCLHEADFE